MKVIKAYSIDVKTAQRIEDYHNDAYGEIGSRSATVDAAIRWYLGDERVSIALLHEKIANLEEGIRRRDQEIEDLRKKMYTTSSSEVTRRSVYNSPRERKWWKILLGIRS